MTMSIPQGIFAASLLAVCAAFVVRGEEWTDPDTGYTWTYWCPDDDTVEIGGRWQWQYGDDGGSDNWNGIVPEGDVTIPAMLDGKTVTSIGDGALEGCGLMTSVTIPEGVKSIGRSAFSNCMELKRILIPNSVTHIGANAFSGCAFESVTLPGRITSIAGGTFAGCAMLKSITIPNGVTLIGDGAFQGCNSLKSVTIPRNVGTIGSYAFADCYNLENVVILDGVTRIANCAFMDCFSLTKLLLPNSVTELGGYAFGWCENLASVTMLNCVMDNPPDEWGAGGDGEMSAVWLSPFYGCQAIRNVTVPRSIESLHLSDFYPNAYASITNVIVLDGTTRISDEAFKDCVGLQSVTLPPSIMQVGSRAFDGCTSLREVLYEGSAPEVGENIYQGTTNSLVTYVRAGSIGWAGGISPELPELWNGRAIAYIGGTPGSGTAHGGGAQTVVTNCVSVTSTNVVIHYVLNGVVPDIAVPADGDEGFVTVVTEIKGGTVAIPESWATNYPSFTAKFGTDFTAALTKPTGKRDSQGAALLVWHDYVAGTDPTNENDVFKASIIMVDGEPVVGYTPILPENERGKRKYTIYGKARLQDELWQIVDGNPGDFNFFKVTVEMR